MQLTLPEPTRYDRAARYLLQRAGGLLFAWLLRLPPERLRFERWLPPHLTLPGAPERVCDAIAELVDLSRGGVPVAALTEVQAQPDPHMTGRLMLAGSLMLLRARPTELPGDRYELLAVVLNLTGVGDAGRSYVVAGGEWTLKPVEVNLSTLDADAVLDEIVGGAAPRELLAFIPLMQRGDEAGIIQRWREVVAAEPDPRRRAGYVTARVFAELADRVAVWQTATEGLSVIESPFIAELLAGAEARGMVHALLQVLGNRFKVVPADVSTAISACTDRDKLNRWLDAALKARTLGKFRQQAGL